MRSDEKGLERSKQGERRGGKSEGRSKTSFARHHSSFYLLFFICYPPARCHVYFVSRPTMLRQAAICARDEPLPPHTTPTTGPWPSALTPADSSSAGRYSGARDAAQLGSTRRRWSSNTVSGERRQLGRNLRDAECARPRLARASYARTHRQSCTALLYTRGPSLSR